MGYAVLIFPVITSCGQKSLGESIGRGNPSYLLAVPEARPDQGDPPGAFFAEGNEPRQLPQTKVQVFPS